MEVTYKSGCTHSRTSVCSNDTLAVLPLASRIGSWADILSDSEEEDASHTSLHMALSSFGSSGEVNSTVKAVESTFESEESVRTSWKPRTPLSSMASEFVPLSRLSSRAPKFVPRSSQTVSETLTKPRAKTSAMLRNLPCSYSRENLVRDMNREGFAGFC